MPDALQKPRCDRHPEALALDLCVSCAAALCPGCTVTTAEAEVYCPDCRPRLAAKRPIQTRRAAEKAPVPVEAAPVPASKREKGGKPIELRAQLLLFLCMAGMVCLPLQLAALVMAVRHLMRVREGRARDGVVAAVLAVGFCGWWLLTRLPSFFR